MEYLGGLQEVGVFSKPGAEGPVTSTTISRETNVFCCLFIRPDLFLGGKRGNAFGSHETKIDENHGARGLVILCSYGLRASGAYFGWGVGMGSGLLYTLGEQRNMFCNRHILSRLARVDDILLMATRNPARKHKLIFKKPLFARF